MDLGRKLRLRRLLPGGRAVIVPMDHPVYHGPVDGLNEPAEVVRKANAGGADGVLLTPGSLETAADALGDMAVVLRLDNTCTRLGKRIDQMGLISTVEDAVSSGVDAVALNVFIGAENEDELMGKLADVACACREWGMVLVGEMIPESLLLNHFGKSPKELAPELAAEHIAVASRVGAEIGADVIKTRYTGTPETFRTVIETATRPVLVAGGPKTGSDATFLKSIRDAMDAGAAGVCVGRNVWQRADMVAMTRAVRAIVHEGATVEQALAILAESTRK
jgi:DhnA family fructose-bisphosphate aldolase class Ia